MICLSASSGLTVCGFIFPVMRSRRSESAMAMVQSAFLSEKEKGRTLLRTGKQLNTCWFGAFSSCSTTNENPVLVSSFDSGH